MNSERPDNPDHAPGEDAAAGSDRQALAGDGRPARRRSPVVIASVAAAVLVAGGGGAYLATTAAGGSGGRTDSEAPGTDAAPPPLALDGFTAGDTGGGTGSGSGGSGGGNNGIAPGEPDPYGPTYRVRGSLPEGPGSAPVYRPAGEVTRGEVTRLAEALGVKGTPVAEGRQGWRVGPEKGGAGPTLRVTRQAPGTWTFQRSGAGSDNCAKGPVCAQPPNGRDAGPVSAKDAEKAAAPVLKALGQDDAKVDASQAAGGRRMVNADPVVGGLPTYGWRIGLSVDERGDVVDGSGLLKAPAKGVTYPVVSARRTLELMSKAPRTEQRMGIGGCASPVPLKDRAEQPCGASGSPSGQEAATVEKAVFGLAAQSVAGRQTLVPSWLFEVRAAGARDAFTVTYPAVDPRYLASPSEPSGKATGVPRTQDVKVAGYSADGRELTVRFTGGVCAEYRATAAESGEQVTVRVTETVRSDKPCILIAKEYGRTMRLDEPLGDRKVVGTLGTRVPLAKPGARLPQAR
ncbi:hypothetical protein [Streptomyces sp. V3I7]|uniref:hypothetical protein n=1 Tax=Streptomyces sp. V3I7 TaxID=3042278 RepID=UPI0027854280|nr:hypothetical protein [Streptomyces sp. V3I7]MDQ0990447.1 hypothetical protein [Streptomyces sp. V3I7]